MELFKEYSTNDFTQFTQVREKFEELLMSYRGITEAVRHLGSGSRSRPRVVSLYTRILKELNEGMSVADVHEVLSQAAEFEFFFNNVNLSDAVPGTAFRRQTKGAAYLRDAAVVCIAMECKLDTSIIVERAELRT